MSVKLQLARILAATERLGLEGPPQIAIDYPWPALFQPGWTVSLGEADMQEIEDVQAPTGVAQWTDGENWWAGTGPTLDAAFEALVAQLEAAVAALASC